MLFCTLHNTIPSLDHASCQVLFKFKCLTRIAHFLATGPLYYMIPNTIYSYMYYSKPPFSTISHRKPPSQSTSLGLYGPFAFGSSSTAVLNVSMGGLSIAGA